MKTSTFFSVLTVLVVGLGYLGYLCFHHEYVTVKCPDCDGTGAASCGAPGCVHGRVHCPNPDCLELWRGDWEHLQVAGHPDTDLWHRFYLSDGSWSAYNQGHVGHVIQLVNGKWTDMGPCPICHGTGWAECPVCHGKIPCPTCHGKGTIQKEVALKKFIMVTSVPKDVFHEPVSR